jgi:hypothetical protein
MAKLTKSELKKVFKEAIRECLQEIIAENSQLVEAIAPKQPKTITETKKISSAESKRIAQGLVSQAMVDERPEDNSPIENPMLIETVNSVANSMTQHDQGKADMMRNILADTAKTTLQEQNSQVGAAGAQPPEVNVESIKELSPNGDTKRWAKIALAKK